MSAGEVVVSYIEKEITAVAARRAALESRAISVITTSGTLVTVLLGLAALSPDELEQSAATRVLVGLALIGFIVAAAFGVWANIPMKFLEVNPETLHAHIAEPLWSADEAKAKREVARVQLESWGFLHAACRRKGRLLFAAFVAQLSAVITLGVAIVLFLV
ncbi:hypothetical protein ACQB60_22700 [Actinomycetota bacterium Odt1-20B]